MGLLLENFKMALSSIKSNKMRSFLTMLGIIIGITSVITISTVGESTKTTLNKFISGFGKNRIIIHINWNLPDSEVSDNASFDLDDVEKIKDKFTKEVSYITPSLFYKQKLTNGKKETQAGLESVDYTAIKEITTAKIIYGRDFKESDLINHKNVVLVDSIIATALYGKADIVGKVLNLETGGGDRQDFLVIGVFKSEKTIFDNMNGNPPSIYAPYTSITTGGEGLSYLDIKINENYNSEKEGKKLIKYMSKFKEVDPKTYELVTLEEQANEINGMLSTMSMDLGAIAAISLIVGGIGIMNIMLVSVTERTREIGIRKSIGARKKDILMQFLIESIILSALGGLIGTILGIGISQIISGLMQVDATVSLTSILIAVAFSTFVGIFFGLYPANKAAKLNPIDALRYE